MHVNDKFHHTMQFHSALSLQKVALPYPFFLFSAIVVFTLSSHLAGEMSGKFKDALEESKSGFHSLCLYAWMVFVVYIRS